MPDTRTPAREELESLLAALLEPLSTTDLASADAASRLNEACPHGGPTWNRIRTLAGTGMSEGWLLPREAGPAVRYGRLAKSLAESGTSVDAVLMSGRAAGHTHPNGEATLAFAWEGEPRFDGHPPGWVVYPPGSHHVPTVTGGRMLFLYFLPGGAVTWDP